MKIQIIALLLLQSITAHASLQTEIEDLQKELIISELKTRVFTAGKIANALDQASLLIFQKYQEVANMIGMEKQEEAPSESNPCDDVWCIEKIDSAINLVWELEKITWLTKIEKIDCPWSDEVDLASKFIFLFCQKYNLSLERPAKPDKYYLNSIYDWTHNTLSRQNQTNLNKVLKSCNVCKKDSEIEAIEKILKKVKPDFFTSNNFQEIAYKSLSEMLHAIIKINEGKKQSRCQIM